MRNNRILILGHPGAGKNYLSDHLSSYLNTRLYDLDDVCFIRKFDIIRPLERKEDLTRRLVQKKDWIICGVAFSFSLIAVPKSTVVIVIKERFLVEVYRIVRRSIRLHLRGEAGESVVNLLKLIWADFKNCHIPGGKHRVRLETVIGDHARKTIVLSSRHDVNRFIRFAKENRDVSNWMRYWKEYKK